MNILQILKRSDTVVGFVSDLSRIRKIPTRINMLFNRFRLINSYLKSNKIRKLQLGASSSPLPGWLNTDIASESDNIIYLDATHVLPFDDDTFDYILCEHMIEHLTWHKGLFMLKECIRVLNPRGIIRIATPDLNVLLGLLVNNGNTLNETYIKWITDNYLDNINLYNAPFVINNAFHCWGHQFLYDSVLLSLTMKEAGFTNIRRCYPGESHDDNLVGIESHGKAVNNEEMACFETMVFEGECPV